MQYWVPYLLVQAFVAFIFLSITGLLAHFFDDALRSVPVEPHYKIYVRTPESVLSENGDRVVDELCSEKFGTCFEVKDELTANGWA
ncbi:hypothetical protein Aduo_019428 [Ancylostoma duodenale]